LESIRENIIINQKILGRYKIKIADDIDFLTVLKIFRRKVAGSIVKVADIRPN